MLNINACWPAGTTLTCLLPVVGTSGGTGISSTATFPSSGVVVTEAASETLTTKTISLDSNTLNGKTGGGAVSAGILGEKIAGTISGDASASTGTLKNMGNVVLTSGVWMIFGNIYATATGTPLAGNIGDVSISTANNTLETASQVRIPIDPGNSVDFISPTVVKYISTSGTTLYLNVTLTFSGTGNFTFKQSNTNFYAIRAG